MYSETIGFIGYRSMGSKLVTTFLNAGVLAPEQIIISTRNRDRCTLLLQRYPSLTIAPDNRTLARTCTHVVIGIRPLDVLPVLKEIAPELNDHTHIISIAGCVRLSDFAAVYDGKISRILPSIVNAVRTGCTLCCLIPG